MAEARPHTAASSSDLSVVLFNVHSSDTSVKAKDRQDCMKEVLDSILASNTDPHPLVLLCQDSINGPKHKIICDKLGQDPKSIRCLPDAGVYYRPGPKGSYLVRYVDVKVLQTIDDGLGFEADNPFAIARLSACVLTLPGERDKRVLLVSWHGPEKKAKKNKDIKSRCFRRLMQFSNRLKTSELCRAVVVGGDFNLPAQDARSVLESFKAPDPTEGVVLDDYTPPPDRPGDNKKIDYIVYWPKTELTSLRTSVVRGEYRREKGTRPFDHPIVEYKFSDPALAASEKLLPKMTKKTSEE